MGFFKNAFGDNRVLKSSNPQVQAVLDYMDRKYSAYIIEYQKRNGSTYMIECRGKGVFNYLYSNGYLQNGHIEVPGAGSIFTSFYDAYDGLMWLKETLDSVCR